MLHEKADSLISETFAEKTEEVTKQQELLIKRVERLKKLLKPAAARFLKRHIDLAEAADHGMRVQPSEEERLRLDMADISLQIENLHLKQKAAVEDIGLLGKRISSLEAQLSPYSTEEN